MSRTTRGMTLVELLVTITRILVVLAPVLQIFAFATRQWGRQVSSTMSMQQATLALDKIEQEVRSSISFSSITVAGNTIYTFTLPNSTDANGNFMPVRQSDGSLAYSGGTQVSYFLSDLTGALSINGGTSLWRATLPVGQLVWLPDTNWSLYSTNKPRYGNVQSFSITSIPNANGTANEVQINLSVQNTEGQQTHTYSLTRQVYLMNSGI